MENYHKNAAARRKYFRRSIARDGGESRLDGGIKLTISNVVCRAAAIALAAAIGFSARDAGAQIDYPNRPIRLVSPSPPAGVHDVIGRLWAERIKPYLGAVVIENKPGAGTLIGASEVARADPDGYTLLIGSTSSHVIAPVLAAHTTFDPLRDLATIGIFRLARRRSPCIHSCRPGRSRT